MQRTMKWFAINGLFAWCVWAGVHEGVTGAANLAQMAVWFFFTVAVLAQSASFVEATAEKMAKPPVPAWLDGCYDTAIVALFVWHGWWVTGVVYLLHCILISAIRGKARDLLAKRAAA